MKEYKDWKEKHYEVIIDFLKFLNERTEDFILKGGTSLRYRYNKAIFNKL